MALYKYLGKLFNGKPESYWKEQKARLIKWRRENSIVKLEKPTNLRRARELGYKAKEGILVVRVRVSRGGHQRPSIKKGRRSKHYGHKLILGKSYQWIAEERVAKKFINLEVLNSYHAGEDGIHKWYEINMIDPHHPAIKGDKIFGQLADQKGRAYRGLTAAGKRSRGILTNKGKGAEKLRPSLRAHNNTGK